MDSYLDEYLSQENEHLFGNGFTQVNNEWENFDWLYSNNKSNNELKSWLINLETHDFKLIIDDIDNNEIPDIIADYDWVTELEIDSQKIKKIKNLPKNLKYLSLFNNDIEEIEENVLPKNLIKINLARNKIKSVKNIPISVKELDVSNNLVKECFLINNTELEDLSLENNLISEIPNLPFQIKNLDLSQNNLNEIVNFEKYEKLEELDISVNKIVTIQKLPDSLLRLSAFSNKIKMILKFPINITHVDLSFNELIWIPLIPEKLQRGDFSSNKINLIALISNNHVDYKNGNLPSNNFIINLVNNPLNNVSEHILNDHRIRHNKIIDNDNFNEKIVNNYYEIHHRINIIL